MALVLEDRFLPATLSIGPMTDEAFAEFCSEHPDLFFEMSAEGELIVMPPTGSLTGIRNAKINSQLEVWADLDCRGYVYDSSSGFVLPNGARRSPDAAWTPIEDVDRLDVKDDDTYFHLCPAFVIELRSHSDRIRTLRAKMNEYIENGAKLGWLLDPAARAIEIYRPGQTPERIENAESVAGEGPVVGFVLDLRKIWEPRARR